MDEKLQNKETNINVYSGWELHDNQRKRLVYDGNDNIIEIYMEKLEGDEWIPVFLQTLTYIGSNIETITGQRL